MNIIIENNIDKILEKIDKERNIFLLTDNNVYNLYRDVIKKYLKDFHINLFLMESGEKYKNKDTVFKIYDSLIENNINRHDIFIALGGGVVGDIGGFVSSTYMRGMKYIQIPTTLLAQVDSSVGGKTGFDYRGYKNIIGTFNQAYITYIDSRFLETLSDRNMISGIGEILKYGLICDYDFFLYVSSNIEKLMNKDMEILNYCIKKSIESKIRFVENDFEDYGMRRKLNFGHTIGHSIESHYEFDKYNHGEGVILGMIYESYISYIMGYIDREYMSDIFSNLSSFIEPIEFNDDEIVNIIEFIEKDKKNSRNNIGMILPVAKGEVSFFDKIKVDIIKNSLKGEWIEDFRKQ